MTEPPLDAPRALAAVVGLAMEAGRWVIPEKGRTREGALKPTTLTEQQQAMRAEAIADLKAACRRWLELEP